MNERRRHLWPWALAGAAGALGLALLHVWTPPGGAGSSVCLLRRFAGLPCPACGLTRAFAHLAKGEWRSAFTTHPLSPLIAAEIALGWAFWGAAATGLTRAARPLPLDRILLANLALLVALWLGRAATGTLPW